MSERLLQVSRKVAAALQEYGDDDGPLYPDKLIDACGELESVVQEIDSRLKQKGEAGGPFTQYMGLRSTALGWADYVQVGRDDDKPMSWREVWDAFSVVYPGRWAAQFFPPEEQLLDQANLYHLFVFNHEPAGFNIRR